MANVTANKTTLGYFFSFGGWGKEAERNVVNISCMRDVPTWIPHFTYLDGATSITFLYRGLILTNYYWIKYVFFPF